MKQDYDYKGLQRKEVWLTKTAIQLLERQAKKEGRTLKRHMEILLTEASKKKEEE